MCYHFHLQQIVLRLTDEFAKQLCFFSSSCNFCFCVKKNLNQKTWISAGTMLGTVLGMSVSGLLCSIPIDHGWPFIFYVFGKCTYQFLPDNEYPLQRLLCDWLELCCQCHLLKGGETKLAIFYCLSRVNALLQSSLLCSLQVRLGFCGSLLGICSCTTALKCIHEFVRAKRPTFSPALEASCTKKYANTPKRKYLPNLHTYLCHHPTSHAAFN